MIKMQKILIGLLMIASLSACQSGGGVHEHESRSNESQYAEKQDRDAYINSPGYLNVQLGIEYMKRGELNLALSKLQKALRLSPELAIAHNTIAVLYERLGEIGLADNHYKRSIGLDPNDSRIRNNYGQFLCRHRGLSPAIEQFDLAANNPLYKAAYLPKANAGMCALNRNEFSIAEQYLREALKLQPKLKPALSSMLRLSVTKGDYLQGRAYLQRYLEVAKHDVNTLWYGYQIESNLGDKAAADNYAVRLQSRYPDSAQTKQLMELLNKR